MSLLQEIERHGLADCEYNRKLLGDQTMKISELTGAALDWAVAKCEKPDWLGNQAEVYVLKAGFHPSTNWEQGGAIIERERISVTPRGNYWNALYHDNIFEDDGSEHSQEALTPLIAAMRCYVESKLGDEIDVPEELINYV